MDVIYTDVNRLPQGVLTKYAIDLDIGNANDYELQTNMHDHLLPHKSIWYVDGTEYGGIVDNVKIDTQKYIVYYSGRTWRGILSKKIIAPDVGQDYYIVSGDANDVLWGIVQRLNLQDFFIVPQQSSNITIVNYQFDRYTDAYSGLVKMLSKAGAKLKLCMTNGIVQLEAVAAEDLSDTYEYSDDYGMQLIMEDNQGGVNHLLCLGQGELKDRIVIHLFVDNNGQIVDNQHFRGMSEICECYDYGNSGTAEELRTKGMDKLKELKNKSTMSAQFTKLDVDVGDIVGGKNRRTGIKLREVVSAQIVKIKNGISTVTYEVGEK